MCVCVAWVVCVCVWVVCALVVSEFVGVCDELAVFVSG